MGKNFHGQIGCKLKEYNWTSKDKPAYKGSNINTDLMYDVTKTIVKKEVRKKAKHIDTVVNSIQYLPLPIKNEISNTHNKQRPQFYCFANNLSTSSRADQYVIYDEISYSYNLTTS